MSKEYTALFSVENQEGMIGFAHSLILAQKKAGRVCKIISTGETLKALQEGGVPAKQVVGYNTRDKRKRSKLIWPRLVCPPENKKSIDLLVTNLNSPDVVTDLGEKKPELIAGTDGWMTLHAAIGNRAILADPNYYDPALEEMARRGGGLDHSRDALRTDGALRLMRQMFMNYVRQDKGVISADVSAGAEGGTIIINSEEARGDVERLIQSCKLSVASYKINVQNN